MKLTTFLACEKIIIDKGGNASLISLMEQVNAEITGLGDAPIPEEVMAPKEWVIVAFWRMQPDDPEGEYVQKIQLYWPNGKLFTEREYRFRPTPPDGGALNFLQTTGIPVGQTGKLRIVVWVEKEGQRVTDSSEMFIKINHIKSVIPEAANVQ